MRIVKVEVKGKDKEGTALTWRFRCGIGNSKDFKVSRTGGYIAVNVGAVEFSLDEELMVEIAKTILGIHEGGDLDG